MTPRTLVYLIGPPGVGKTTLMAELTSACDREPRSDPVPHDALMRNGALVGAEAGRRRDAFSGTDALAMDIQPKATKWVSEGPYDLLLAEGARLGTTGFLYAARAARYRVLLFALDCDDKTLTERRNGRGSNQNPKWMRGASTRARMLVQRMAMDAEVRYLNAALPVADLAETMLKSDDLLGALRA